MKMAFVTQPWEAMTLPSGSIEVWEWQVARRLAQEADVIVYARTIPGEPVISKREGVTFRRVSPKPDAYLLKLLNRLKWFWPFKHPLFASRLFHLFYIMQVSLDLRRQNCDIVQLFTFPQFAPMIKMLNPGVKVCLWMGCRWLSQLDRRLMGRYMQSIDIAAGCSRFVTEEVASAFAQVASKCTVLYAGFDPELFTPAQPRDFHDEPVLLYVGRMSPEKGVHVLVEAYLKIVEHYPKAKLRLIGPLSSMPQEYLVDLDRKQIVRDLARFYEEEYVETIRSMIPPHLERQVEFAGILPHRELPAHYRRADVFVFPSICDEAFGNPPIEAMLSGVPVVVSRAGGMPEYISEGETGLLAEPGNAEQFAEAIERLLKDRDLRTHISVTARQMACERFSARGNAAEFARVYTELLPDAAETGVPSGLGEETA